CPRKKAHGPRSYFRVTGGTTRLRLPGRTRPSSPFEPERRIEDVYRKRDRARGQKLRSALRPDRRRPLARVRGADRRNAPYKNLARHRRSGSEGQGCRDRAYPYAPSELRRHMRTGEETYRYEDQGFGFQGISALPRARRLRERLPAVRPLRSGLPERLLSQQGKGRDD